MRVARNILTAAVFPLVAVAAMAGEPLGLVLSGGGAKGAYEVGVWNALREAGLDGDVAAISGTSVGALNAAMFAACPDRAETLWREYMGRVFTLDTKRIGQSLQKTLDTASTSVRIAREENSNWKGLVHFLLSTALRTADKAVSVTMEPVPVDGYIDSGKLADALREALPETWPDGAPSVYATAVEKDGWTGRTWRLNDEPHERRVLMIRASAALPLGFDTVSFDGKTYVDGGWEGKGGDNVPLGPILENHPGIKTVLLVWLHDGPNIPLDVRAEKRRAAREAGVRLVEIFASEDIDGLVFGWQGALNASPANMERLIRLGHDDMQGVLETLGPVRR